MPYPALESIKSNANPLGLKILHRFGAFFSVLLLGYLTVWITFLLINPNVNSSAKEIENARWIATSKSWLDRISCRQLGICGGSNWLLSTWLFTNQADRGNETAAFPLSNELWIDRGADPDSWPQEEKRLRQIPDFVFRHAPLIYLHGKERWWPSDVAEFLHHIEYVRGCGDVTSNISLPDLAHLISHDKFHERAFLRSIDDPDLSPAWLTNRHNIPGNRDLHRRTNEHKSDYQHQIPSPQSQASKSHEPKYSPDSVANGRSLAPAFLITVKKENGTLDAFWFFFYAFNRGARVTGIQYGNHVGDWEHVMIRFIDGIPEQVFLSAHEWGSAYHYDALENLDSHPSRPVVYAGLGSHAHYATPGKHAYALPFGLLGDHCERGQLWDPTLNLLSYVYRPEVQGYPQQAQFLASTHNPRAHASWLEFKGRWGDLKYSLGDSQRQNYRFAGEHKYLNGPNGPWDKALGRCGVCEFPEKACELRRDRYGYVGPIKGTEDSIDTCP